LDLALAELAMLQSPLRTRLCSQGAAALLWLRGRGEVQEFALCYSSFKSLAHTVHTCAAPCIHIHHIFLLEAGVVVLAAKY